MHIQPDGTIVIEHRDANGQLHHPYAPARETWPPDQPPTFEFYSHGEPWMRVDAGTITTLMGDHTWTRELASKTNQPPP